MSPARSPALEEPVTAIFPAGGPPGRLLEQLVRDAAIPMRPIPATIRNYLAEQRLPRRP